MNIRIFTMALLTVTAASGTAHAQAVIDLNDPANANRTTWSVARGTDVVVIGSNTPRSRQISIQGANDVEVRGGVWKPTTREYDGTIHTKNITGSVTITGARIDNSGVPGADGVVVNAGGTTKVPFLMSNSTITGIRGKQGGDHADGVQPQGAVSTFRMENVKIDTDYQGLMLADQPNIPYGGKVDTVELSNVAINKLPGGEGGCRYPIITGGNQQVSLSNVSVYSQSGCRGNGVLNVDNRARISGEVSYGGQGSVTGADGGIAPVGPQGFGQQQDTGWVEDAIQNMAARGYSTEQIKARFADSGVNLGAGTIDAIVAGALGTDLGVGREVMNAITGQNVSGLQNDLVNEGIIMAEDLAGQYAPELVGLLEGGACSSMVMDAVAGAASAVAGFFTGGRSTVVAQLAQQVQLAWANKCNGEMNDKLASLAEYERKNISNGSVNGIPGINGMLDRSLGGLGRGGLLSNESQVQGDYQRQFPDAFNPMSKDQLVQQNIKWDNTARTNQLNAFAIENRAMQEQVRSVGRARDFAAAGREGPGIRAELQAANAIQGEQVAAINNLTAATVASNRVAAAREMRNEAEKKAAHASVDQYMESLAVCSNCGISTPFLKP